MNSLRANKPGFSSQKSNLTTDISFSHDIIGSDTFGAPRTSLKYIPLTSSEGRPHNTPQYIVFVIQIVLNKDSISFFTTKWN